MRQINAVILTSLVSVCLLGSCNKPADEGEVTPPPSSAGTSGTSVANTPPDATGAAGQSSTPDGSVKDSGTKSMPVEPVDLSGKWIALFGRTPGGSTIEDAYKTGEVLEFKSSNGVIWTKKAGAAPADYTFTVEGDTLTLNPGMVQNVGRDDEVGLLNVGRDDEVGLNDGKAPQKSTTGTGKLKKTLFRDGNFLAVTGTEDDIMVYGKVDAPGAAQPEIAGKYTGDIAGNGPFPAEFEWKDNYLEAKLDDGKGVFKGMFAEGYFVGPANGTTGTGLAAITRLPDGKLDGVFLPLPFTHMNSIFDFAPGQ